MKTKINQLIKSTFIKNVAIMVAGTVGAQILTLLLTPIITRLYGPDAFGLMGTFTAMINIIIPIAALQYPTAIVLPKSEQEAKGLVRLSIYLTLGSTVISLIFVLFFQNGIVSLFGLEELAIYLYLIPLVVLFSGMKQIGEHWLIRKEQFKVNARAILYQSLLINSSKVGVGFYYPTAFVLIALTAINNAVKAILLLLFSENLKDVIKQSFRTKIKGLIKKYNDFPLYRAPVTLLSAISQGLPVLMLTTFFGPASAGFYTLGRTTLTIPSRLIGKSVEDVFYPHLADTTNKEKNPTTIIKKTTLLLALIGLIPFGLVIVFGPALFTFVFGNGWLTAGEYARWIALLAFARFMVRPSLRALTVLNAQRTHLIYTIIILVSNVIALTVGYYLFASDLYAIALFGISGAILNFILLLITINTSEKWSRNNAR